MKFLASLLICLFLVILTSCHDGSPRDWSLYYHYDTKTYVVVQEPFNPGFNNYQLVEDSLTFTEAGNLYQEAIKLQAFTDKAH